MVFSPVRSLYGEIGPLAPNSAFFQHVLKMDRIVHEWTVSVRY